MQGSQHYFFVLTENQFVQLLIQLISLDFQLRLFSVREFLVIFSLVYRLHQKHPISLLWKSFSASVLCSLLVRIMLWAKTHSSHQKEQHWKQYKVWALRLSQFPHFTLAVLHSLIAKTSSRLSIRKLVGSSLGFPLPEI